MLRSSSASLARLSRYTPLRSRWGAFAFVACALVAQASPAKAFCRNTTCKDTDKKTCLKDDKGCTTEGNALFWPTSCIEFHMNEQGTQFLDLRETRTAIMKAFRSWSAVDCGGGKQASMTFVAKEDVACKKAEYNRDGKNVNVVLFQDSDWKYRGIDGTLAKTSTTFDTDTGEIFDADIEVNTAFNKVTVTDTAGQIQYDLQAILAHEVGHFLGIGHSENERATMYARYVPGTTEIRQLNQDDKDAVCAAYPPNNGVACNQEPRGGYSATCDGTPAADPETSCAAAGDPARGSSDPRWALALAGSMVVISLGRRGLGRRLTSERAS